LSLLVANKDSIVVDVVVHCFGDNVLHYKVTAKFRR